eukprot:TRINITY_DN16601_c0_g1_i1.p3 TRINITY_DN16601_c0_g1~~TRINITY_DN16601_c0_g1_i1.p3  ORF type:complete len:120 (-),score=20.95 TRINITY_DN16601_c0_g1_i1:885-1244(-)
MTAFQRYIPKGSPEQVLIILEAVQSVVEELPKKGGNYTEKFVEVFKGWFGEEGVVDELLNSGDLHVAHEMLGVLEKVWELDGSKEIRKLFNDSEVLHIAIKKMISPTKSDFLKFSKSLK